MGNPEEKVQESAIEKPIESDICPSMSMMVTASGQYTLIENNEVSFYTDNNLKAE